MPISLFVPVPTCTLNISASSVKNQTTARRQRKPAAPDARAVSTLSVGENLVATVRNIGGADSAWLDINCGTLSGKLVHARLRMYSNSKKRARQVPPAGSTISVRVSKLNVPAARVEVVPAWELPFIPPPPPQYRLEELYVGQKMAGVVVGVVASGAVVDVSVSRLARRGARRQCTGLLRRAHFAPAWASSADLVVSDTAERVISVGDALDVYVRDASVHCGALFLNATPITVGQVNEERRAWRRRLALRYRRKGIDSLSVGEVRTGTVRVVQKYGCFVDVGVKAGGLVHFSNMGERHSRTWKTTVPEGARVAVEVIDIKEERFNLRLIGVVGDDEENGDGQMENPATVRAPQPVATANDELGEIFDKGEKVVEEEGLDDDGVEVHGQSLENKFTDEYFEDKYDF